MTAVQHAIAHSTVCIVAIVTLAQSIEAKAGHYVQERSYVGENFFSRFWFWKWPDLTHGHVEFVSENDARALGLVGATKDRVYMSADRSSSTGGSPRKSIKIFSNDVYNSGLFVLSLDHTPTGCGTWPAFWMTGGNSKDHWPSWGEFDIIEGVHTNSQVATALHTNQGCDQSAMLSGRDFAGVWQQGLGKPFASDCYIHAPGQWRNQGCSQMGPGNSMGPGFNAAGGGTFAAQWAPLPDGNGYFRTWFWRNGTEPIDLLNGQPDPDRWGLPYSRFNLGAYNCRQEHFKNMRLVFDLTFCGDMAGTSFNQKCPADAAVMSCQDLVSYHPEAMRDAYWSIRRLDTYQWQEYPPAAAPNPPVNPTPERKPSQAPGCQEYGCHDAYRAGQACQCNVQCLSYNNCCDDVQPACGVNREAAPGEFHSAFVGAGEQTDVASSAQEPQQKVARGQKSILAFMKRFGMKTGISPRIEMIYSRVVRGPLLFAMGVITIGAVVAFGARIIRSRSWLGDISILDTARSVRVGWQGTADVADWMLATEREETRVGLRGRPGRFAYELDSLVDRSL